MKSVRKPPWRDIKKNIKSVSVGRLLFCVISFVFVTALCMEELRMGVRGYHPGKVLKFQTQFGAIRSSFATN